MATRRPSSDDDDDVQPQTALAVDPPPAKKTRKKKTEAEKPARKKAETKIETAPAPAGEPAASAFRFIVFGDLHVGAKTLDRALEVLTRVGELARANDATIVCTGDLWHQRASLSVRQLDAVLNVIASWPQAVMLPGNHDQVSRDGSVHAMNVFASFPHIAVATEPLIDPDSRIAFIPWREEPEEQERIVASLDGTGWTVFAHAEVEGATTNHSHTAPGRVKLSTIESVCRAFYAGHYHKRQKLGTRTWYLGSPFEMDFGEMDSPKGVALITNDSIEPVFLDIDDFPKHVRVLWPDEREKLAKAREQDIVEVIMSHADLRGAGLATALASTKAKDVRPLLAPVKKADGAPPIALTLDAALTEWVREAETIDATRKGEVERLAREVLSEVNDTKTINPIAPKVSILGVYCENFCALKGSVHMNLDKMGPVLLRGPMGVGKTSLCDAITWCVTGQTAPRKAGTNTSSLKADDVIHDDAGEVRVRVPLRLQGPEGEHTVTIERTKKRGQGAKIRIEGLAVKEGIEDTQEIVNRIIGMDIDLWRSTVYLGQGAVANFITDADKRRKELLARAFGLSACEPALAKVKERLKKVTMERQSSEQAVDSNRRMLDSLRASDFSAQASVWETNRHAAIEGQQRLIADEQARIATSEPHLAHEGAWLTHKMQYEAHLDALTKQLATASTEVKATQLHAQLGGLHTERAALVRKYEGVSQRMTRYASDAGAMCHTCGHPLDPERQAIQLYEAQQEGEILVRDVGTLDVRIANLNTELGALRAGDAPNAAAIQQQIADTRTALSKCNDALTAIARIKDAVAHSHKRIAEAQAEIAKQQSTANPFAAQAADTASRVAFHEGALAVASNTLANARALIANLEECETMFSQRGLPVLVLRTVIYELETYANHYLNLMLGGLIHCQVTLADDDLDVMWYEYKGGKHHERNFLQLSGGQRRCAELAFSPFALAEMIFNRCGVRIPFLVVDELTTHLDADTKPLLCDMLRKLDRETVIVIDHDQVVKGEFDVIFDVSTSAGGVDVRRADGE